MDNSAMSKAFFSAGFENVCCGRGRKALMLILLPFYCSGINYSNKLPHLLFWLSD